MADDPHKVWLEFNWVWHDKSWLALILNCQPDIAVLWCPVNLCISWFRQCEFQHIVNFCIKYSCLFLQRFYDDWNWRAIVVVLCNLNTIIWRDGLLINSEYYISWNIAQNTHFPQQKVEDKYCTKYYNKYINYMDV